MDRITRFSTIFFCWKDSNWVPYEQMKTVSRTFSGFFARFYTSFDLVEALQQEYSLTCVGLLSARRKGLPSQVKSLSGRAEGDYMALFLQSDETVSIHSWITSSESGGFFFKPT